MRRIPTIEKEIKKLEKLIAPFEAARDDLLDELAAAKTKQRGKIRKCDLCRTDIYKDKYCWKWRSFWSNSACCGEDVNGPVHVYVHNKPKQKPKRTVIYYSNNNEGRLRGESIEELQNV